MEAAVFFISAAIILAGGLGVILLGNPVHAALSLVMTLFGVAVLFINLEAYFVAVVQVIVYAGAIVVLFLFVIMLVGVDRVEDVRAEPLIGQREFAALVGAGLLAIAIVIGVGAGAEVTGSGDPGLEIVTSEDIDADGDDDNSNIKQIGRVLFTDYVFAFEITALLLTISVVGAVVLSRRPKQALQPIPELAPPWPMRVGPEPEPGLEVVTDVADEAGESPESADESSGDAETHDEEASK